MNNYLLNSNGAIERILIGAEVVIKKQGVCSFKMSSIAKYAACSTKTLYRLFHSKEDIIVALFIKHINEIQDKCNVISSTNSLSNKEVIIYSLMYDPLKCWTSEEDDLCINFLGVNPHIYSFSSPEFVGNLQAIFCNMKEKNQIVWGKAISDGELHSNKEDILRCMFLLREAQRGAIVIGQNKFMRQFGYDSNTRSTFDVLCGLVNTLDWSVTCENLNYENMLKTVAPLLGRKNTSQNHYALKVESLKDPIDI